jgi:hypothetical protein
MMKTVQDKYHKEKSYLLLLVTILQQLLPSKLATSFNIVHVFVHPGLQQMNYPYTLVSGYKY